MRFQIIFLLSKFHLINSNHIFDFKDWRLVYLLQMVLADLYLSSYVRTFSLGFSHDVVHCFEGMCGEGVDPQCVLAVPQLLFCCYYFSLIFLTTAKWSSPKCLSAKEGIPLILSSLASIVVRRASWFPLEYSLLDTLLMSLYSYSNMFFGCLVSLLNLCRLKY